MKPPGSTVERTSSRTWEGFFLWVILGAAAAFGLVIFGAPALLAIILAVVLPSTRRALRRSGFGVLTGAGAMSLYVAYVQRRGPGTVCWHTATAAGCDQYANPWPWLVAGVALVVVGFIAHGRRMRARS